MSFSFDINLNGVQAAGGSLTLVEGYYNAQITECYVDEARNSNRVLFKLSITDSPYTGSVRVTGLNMPKGTDDKVRYYWRAALESCGYSAAQLDNANGLQISDQLFVGRSCTIYYKPKDDNAIVDADRYEKVNFLNKADWDLKKKVFDSAPQTTVQASAAGTVPSPSIPTSTAIPAPQAGFAGNGMTTDQLMQMVGNRK
jgi:hypothetical protein